MPSSSYPLDPSDVSIDQFDGRELTATDTLRETAGGDASPPAVIGVMLFGSATCSTSGEFFSPEPDTVTTAFLLSSPNVIGVMLFGSGARMTLSMSRDALRGLWVGLVIESGDPCDDSAKLM